MNRASAFVMSCSALFVTLADRAHAQGETAAHARWQSQVEVATGPEWLAREFEFRDERFDRLPAYEVPAALAYRTLLRVSPTAFAPHSGLDHLQLTADLEQVLALDTEFAGRRHETSSQAWLLGMRVRIPTGSYELAGELAYGHHSFGFAGDAWRDATGASWLPSVNYELLRVGFGARFEIEHTLVGIQVGHRFVSQAGEIRSESWFPRLEASGLDVGIMVGWAVTDRLGLLLAVDTRRYVHDLNPAPGSGASTRDLVAGGAVDVFSTWWLALGWWLDSAPERLDPEEEAEL